MITLNPERTGFAVRAHTAPSLLLLLLLLSSGAAVAALPVSLHPISVKRLSTESEVRFKVRSMLQSGLMLGMRRGVFVARNPLETTTRCAATPTTECLSRLAGEGGVIYATALEKDTTIEVTLELIDGEGTRTPSLRFEMPSFFVDDRVAGRALEALEQSYLEQTRGATGADGEIVYDEADAPLGANDLTKKPLKLFAKFHTSNLIRGP